jgi:hypothetical protein
MESNYEKQLKIVEELNELNKGKVYMHTERKTYYKITGFSLMKSSSDANLDESIAIHYNDTKGRPHSRTSFDFFGFRKAMDAIVPRFVEVDKELYVVEVQGE